MKTSELIDQALNWAVANSEGIIVTKLAGSTSLFIGGGFDKYNPSTNWSQGGPIIEREGIDLFTEKGTTESWVSSIARRQNGVRLEGWSIYKYGPTPLIAAMRAYVALKLGDEVEIPEEIKCLIYIRETS